jgi:DNA-binding NarL/FixJ family response regulator
MNESTPQIEGRMDLSRLPPRRLEVLMEVVRGHGNAAIAKVLGISEKTVKSHITHVLKATGCTQRSQLIARYYMDREAARLESAA